MAANCSRETFKLCDASIQANFASKLVSNISTFSRSKKLIFSCKPEAKIASLLQFEYRMKLILLVALFQFATLTRSVTRAQIDESSRQAVTTSNTFSDNHSKLEEASQSELANVLATLPIVNATLKRSVEFECPASTNPNPNSNSNSAKSRPGKILWSLLSWRRQQRRRRRPSEPASGAEASDSLELSPLSLDDKLITPDRRFKVRRRDAAKWLLSLANVSSGDDALFVLCQAGGGGGDGRVSRLIAGYQLRVLEPPTIVEPSSRLVRLDLRSPSGQRRQLNGGVFAEAKLQCTVASPPNSQRATVSWKREDGRPLNSSNTRIESLRVQHLADADVGVAVEKDLEAKSRWLETSELTVTLTADEADDDSLVESLAGAYLCIANNAIPPAVSQRLALEFVTDSLAARSRKVAGEQATKATPQTSNGTQETRRVAVPPEASFELGHGVVAAPKLNQPKGTGRLNSATPTYQRRRHNHQSQSQSQAKQRKASSGLQSQANNSAAPTCLLSLLFASCLWLSLSFVV